MKSFILFLVAWCLWWLAVAHAEFGLEWFTIDGGGSSTGGVYAVSGAIGQPDAGWTMTGGDFTLTGGFWVLPIVVQTPGAPLLTIAAATPGFATIRWAPESPGFVLQQCPGMVPPAWTNSVSGTTNPVVVPLTTPRMFYRLFKPKE